MNELTKFEIHPELQRIADRIRERVARTAYEIGQELLAAKALAERGEWGGFLLVAGINQRTAQHLMAYATKRDDEKYARIAHLEPSAFMIEAREVDKANSKDERIAELEAIRAALKEELDGLLERREKLEAALKFAHNPEAGRIEWEKMINTAKKQSASWQDKFKGEKAIGFGLTKRLKKLEASAA